jgi:uncharacterized membrane-anchored protein
MTTPTPDKSQDKEELARQFKELVDKFDKELRDKGLTDEQREQLLRELLEDEDDNKNAGEA